VVEAFGRKTVVHVISVRSEGIGNPECSTEIDFDRIGNHTTLVSGTHPIVARFRDNIELAAASSCH